MKTCVAAFFVMLFGSCSLPARAEIVEIKFSGIVTAGIDVDGIFGGGDLTGETYAVSEFFDLSNANNSLAHEGDASPTLPYYFSGCYPGQICASGFLRIGSSIFDFAAYGSEYGSFTRGTGNAFTASLLDRGGLRFYEAQLLTKFDGTSPSGMFQTTDGTFGDGTGSTIVLGSGNLVSAVPLPGTFPMLGTALLGLIGLSVAKRRNGRLAIIAMSRSNAPCW